MSRFKKFGRRFSLLVAGLCSTAMPTSAVWAESRATTRSLSSDTVTYAPGASVRENLEFETSTMPTSAQGTGTVRGGYPVATQMPQEPMQINTPNFHMQSGNSMPADCCMGCDRSFYVIYDSLWIKRFGDEGFSLSRGLPINEDFSFQHGGRYTIGQMFDCLDGVEAVYTGPLVWQTGTTNGNVHNAAFNPPTVLVPGGAITAADLAGFNAPGSTQTDLWRAKFQSFEFNRRWWAWDVLSTMVGVRSIAYDETYIMSSTPPVGPSAVFYQQTKNFLTGGQLGIDLSYPLSQRMSFGSRLRGGIYTNYNRGLTQVVRGGANFISNPARKEVDISGMIEAGSSIRYHVLPRAVLVAGYETWIMPGVASVTNQRTGVVTENIGRRLRATDTVFFQGATASLEISF